MNRFSPHNTLDGSSRSGRPHAPASPPRPDNGNATDPQAAADLTARQQRLPEVAARPDLPAPRKVFVNPPMRAGEDHSEASDAAEKRS